jgi:hypothetical protein
MYDARSITIEAIGSDAFHMKTTELDYAYDCYFEARHRCNPRELGSYINAVERVLRETNRVIHDPSFKKKTYKENLTRELGLSMRNVRNARNALEDLRGFYERNVARYENGQNVTKLKSGDFPIHKGLVPLGPGDSTALTGRFCGALAEKLTFHLEREMGQPAYQNYLQYLAAELEYGESEVKNASYMAAKYMLVNDQTCQAFSAKCRQGALEIGGMFDQQELVIDPDDRRLYGFYTVTERRGKNIAKPGWHGPLEDDFPSVLPAHTLKTAVQIGNKSIEYRARTSTGVFASHGEMSESLKYAMRDDKLYVETGYADQLKSHPEAVDFKRVQSAGGIMAREGKVLAVDNFSGHYRPGWELLAQVVKLLNKGRVLDPTCAVGVQWRHGESRVMFFPVGVFLALVNAEFRYLELKRFAEEAFENKKLGKSGLLNDERILELARVGPFFEKWWWLGAEADLHYEFSTYCRTHRR